MLFTNANLFLDGCFQRGAFRVENGRFAEILTDAAANGVTSFAPASMTLPYDVLEAAYKTAAALKKNAPEGCARLMGINMEGPFFSEKKKGAQNGAYLRLPDFEAFRALYEASEGERKLSPPAGLRRV